MIGVGKVLRRRCGDGTGRSRERVCVRACVEEGVSPTFGDLRCFPHFFLPDGSMLRLWWDFGCYWSGCESTGSLVSPRFVDEVENDEARGS